MVFTTIVFSFGDDWFSSLPGKTGKGSLWRPFWQDSHDLWMRKWKRNQILLSPSTINATFQDFANGWSAVLSHRSHQAIGTSIAITIYLKAPLTPYKNECRSKAVKVVDYKFKCVNFWRHFWIHNWDQSVTSECYIHIPVLHIVTQKGQWLQERNHYNTCTSHQMWDQVRNNEQSKPWSDFETRHLRHKVN